MIWHRLGGTANGDDEPGVVLIARYRPEHFHLRKHSMLAECMRQTLHTEEGKLMTRASRIPLHRKLTFVALAITAVTSSFSVDAQYHRPPPGYHRPPPPRYYGPRRRGGDGGGALIAGALLGVVAGAAIANSSNAAAAAPPPGVVYSSPPPPPPPGVVYYDNGAPPPPGY